MPHLYLQNLLQARRAAAIHLQVWHRLLREAGFKKLVFSYVMK